MKHPERIEDYLDHIAQAIDRATGYLEPVSSMEAFEKHPPAQDAVIRNIEIIGEAVIKIQKQAPEFVKAHPELPCLTYGACATRLFTVTSMWSRLWSGRQ